MWLKIIGVVCAGAFVSAAFREIRSGGHRKKHQVEPEATEAETEPEADDSTDATASEISDPGEPLPQN